MITIKPVVRKDTPMPDGSYRIKIRITLNRKSKYIPTSAFALRDELDRNYCIKWGTPAQVKASQAVEQIQAIIDKAPLSLTLSGDVNDVYLYIKDKSRLDESFRLDFIKFGYEVASHKSESSKNSYRSALEALKRFACADSIDISEITVKFLRQFERFIRDERIVVYKKGVGRIVVDKPKGERVIGAYLGYIRFIYQQARLEFNEPDRNIVRIPNNPFEYYKIPKQPSAKHRDVSPEIIQLMINQRRSLVGKKRIAIDIFLISFALMGMNATDLYDCEKARVGIISYNRNKTKDRRSDNAFMRVRIPECIHPVISEHEGRSRFLDLSGRFSRVENLTTTINDGLKAWCADNHLEPFTFYSARHSWATIGRSAACNIDKATINDGLCHVDPSMKETDIYARIDWNVLWNANDMIMSVFDWSNV